jgi:hypothetical protein
MQPERPSTPASATTQLHIPAAAEAHARAHRAEEGRGGPVHRLKHVGVLADGGALGVDGRGCGGVVFVHGPSSRSARRRAVERGPFVVPGLRGSQHLELALQHDEHLHTNLFRIVASSEDSDTLPSQVHRGKKRISTHRAAVLALRAQPRATRVPDTATKKRLRIVTVGFRVGDRSLTRPLRDARRFPSTRWHPVYRGARVRRESLGFVHRSRHHSLCRAVPNPKFRFAV